MIEQKLPKEMYEFIPTEYVIQRMKSYQEIARIYEEDGEKESANWFRERADTLSDLLEGYVMQTVAEEPDVIEAAKKAYSNAVDSFSIDDGEPLIQILKD